MWQLEAQNLSSQSMGIIRQTLLEKWRHLGHSYQLAEGCSVHREGALKELAYQSAGSSCSWNWIFSTIRWNSLLVEVAPKVEAFQPDLQDVCSASWGVWIQLLPIFSEASGTFHLVNLSAPYHPSFAHGKQIEEVSEAFSTHWLAKVQFSWLFSILYLWL